MNLDHSCPRCQGRINGWGYCPKCMWGHSHGGAHVIHSKEEFLAQLKVGDTFWTMSSWGNSPSGIQGPCVIESIHTKCYGVGGPSVAASGLQPPFIGSRYVPICDLVNMYHGVFLTERDAKLYFEARTDAWKYNPYLQEINRLNP